MKFGGLIARVLLLLVGFHCVFCSKEDVKFKVRINERGTRFSEKIKINEKENTVRFKVPKHNDVDQSEVLNNFNLNLTITRLPAKRVCYIQPLDKSLTSPRKLKSDLTYVRRVQARIQKAGTLVSSTEMSIDRQMEGKDLHPIVIKFCAGFPVYRLKEMSKDSIEIEQEERSSKDSAVTRKRRLDKRSYPMCQQGLNYNLPCTADKWKMHCKIVGRTCVYWAQCDINDLIKTHPVSLQGGSTDPCGFVHNFSSVVCCEFRCS